MMNQQGGLKSIIEKAYPDVDSSQWSMCPASSSFGGF